MYRHLKSIFDVFFAFIGVIVLAPIFLITIIAIRLDSKGKAVFRQARTGKDGVTFFMYKFRSMYSTDVHFDKDNPVISDNNKNLTKVGRIIRKIKLDEAIQILNIIRGEMSFVGPRPLKVEYLDEYEEWEKIKLAVKPGLGGLAQVNGSGHLDIKERNYYDMKYVENFSFLNDVKIFFRTIKVVFVGEEKVLNRVPTEEMQKFSPGYVRKNDILSQSNELPEEEVE